LVRNVSFQVENGASDIAVVVISYESVVVDKPDVVDPEVVDDVVVIDVVEVVEVEVVVVDELVEVGVVIDEMKESVVPFISGVVEGAVVVDVVTVVDVVKVEVVVVVELRNSSSLASKSDEERWWK